MELNQEDLPIAATYILVEDSDETLAASRLEESGYRKHDSVEHGIRKRDVPMAESLLLGLEVL